MIQHGGGIDGFVTIITRFPDDKATIIVLCNQQNTSLDAVHRTLVEKLFRDE
jgi:hypothetical protein